MKTSSVLLQQREQASSLALRRIQLHRKKKKVSYSGYMYRIRQQVSQDANKPCWAMDVIHSLSKSHLYEKVALKAARQPHYKKKLLVTSSEVHAAIKGVLLRKAIKVNLEDAVLTVSVNKCVDAT